MTMTIPNSGTLAERLEELWADEWCKWTVEYEGGLYHSTPHWTVTLSWACDSHNPHGADWVEYSWQFYGGTLLEALIEAVTWAEALLPWKRCAACDGKGSWQGGDIPCDECGGSGLDSDVARS